MLQCVPHEVRRLSFTKPVSSNAALLSQQYPHPLALEVLLYVARECDNGNFAKYLTINAST